jgi:hypothetical protein
MAIDPLTGRTRVADRYVTLDLDRDRDGDGRRDGDRRRDDGIPDDDGRPRSSMGSRRDAAR